MRRLELPFRTLFRTPFVTIVAILSLALGIGANAGIYSLFDEVLLAPLPVSHPDRLVNFASTGPQVMYYNCGTAGDCDGAFDYPMFRDLERGAAKTAFNGIAGHMPFSVSLTMPGQTPISGDGVLVSGSYFPVLGLQPALGRLLAPADDQTTGEQYGNTVAVLSYAFWENTLGASPSVLGKPITVNGRPLTIIGVAPHGFSGTTLGARPDVFVPISMTGAMIDGWKGVESGSRGALRLHLRPARAGRHDRARGRLDQPDLSRDHQRRRGATAQGRWPPDCGTIPGRGPRA